MSKRKSLSLSVLFLAIALFVSGSLVASLHTAYGGSGPSPNFNTALRLLQNA